MASDNGNHPEPRAVSLLRPFGSSIIARITKKINKIIGGNFMEHFKEGITKLCIYFISYLLGVITDVLLETLRRI